MKLWFKQYWEYFSVWYYLESPCSHRWKHSFASLSPAHDKISYKWILRLVKRHRKTEPKVREMNWINLLICHSITKGARLDFHSSVFHTKTIKSVICGRWRTTCIERFICATVEKVKEQFTKSVATIGIERKYYFLFFITYQTKTSPTSTWHVFHLDNCSYLPISAQIKSLYTYLSCL